MGAIRLRLGAELRARWRGWLGLALLLAAFAGLTFATAAGARRTDSAYPRLLKASHPFDQFLLGVGPAGGYVARLDSGRQARLRDLCEEMLPPAPFVVSARAWAARGRPS